MRWIPLNSFKLLTYRQAVYSVAHHAALCVRLSSCVLMMAKFQIRINHNNYAPYANLMKHSEGKKQTTVSMYKQAAGCGSVVATLAQVSSVKVRKRVRGQVNLRS
ncbi:hypothetical protein PoB_003870500 [Plakobranchus ocellatus]|uniref:Uncharacterized protein n=1 Tax=Plakobranchus ocellatus TaxID=259542 RepID=A0AAV4AY49_9GAST|nr:hypothetical protein PoB_003870500 [Plakobranchus ocellatus]